MAYTGLVTGLPIGQRGFNASQGSSIIDPAYLTYTRGWVVENGILRKEGGASKFNSTTLASGAVVLAGINWSPAGSTLYDVVALDDGSVRRDDAGAGTFGTTLVSGLTIDDEPPPVFVAAGGEAGGATRKLYMFGAGDQVQVVSGTSGTMADISGPASDWASNYPTFGVLHANRMFAGGNANDPHRLYYTPTSDHGDYTTGGTISIYPGEGEKIVAAASVRGVLIVWKYPHGIYAIDTTDATPANWVVTKLSAGVGGINQHCVVQALNDVLFLDQNGMPHLLSLVNILGDFETSNIGKQIRFDRFLENNIDRTKLFKSVMTYYAQRQQVWLGLVANGDSDNTMRVIIDFSDPSVGVRYFLSERDTMVSLWTRYDATGIPKPVSGDDAGFVWLMDRPDRNKDGSAYTAYCETPDMDFGFVDPALVPARKTMDFLELRAEANSEWITVVTVWADDIQTAAIQFSAMVGGEVLGSFTLGTDTLAGTLVAASRRRITGTGRKVRFTFLDEGLDQDVMISLALLSFRRVNEDIKRET